MDELELKRALSCRVVLVDIYRKRKPPKSCDISSQCSACGSSKEKNPERLFHCFPKEKERCGLWIKKCNLKGLEGKNPTYLNLHYKLCGDHFDESSYSGNRLTATAVPNKNLRNVIVKNLKKKLTLDMDHELEINGTRTSKGGEKAQKIRRKDAVKSVAAVNNGVAEPRVISTTCPVSKTVNNIIQNLPESHKKIRILRINNVPTGSNDPLSTTSLEKIRSMLQKFSSDENCNIEEIIKIVKTSETKQGEMAVDQNGEPGKTYTRTPSVVANTDTTTPMPARNVTTQQNNISSTSKNVQSPPTKVFIWGPNSKNSGKTADIGEHGRQVPAAPATPGRNCNICKGRLPEKASDVMTQKLGDITYARQASTPLVPQKKILPLTPSMSIEKVPDINKISVTKKSNHVLENIQNENVLAMRGVNAKMSFDDITSLEDFDSDRPTIMNVFSYQRVENMKGKNVAAMPGMIEKPPFEDKASSEEFNRDVPTIMNVFSYPLERWINNVEREKPPKPPPVKIPKPPPVCCRGKCPKCKKRRDERTAKIRRLSRSLKSYTDRYKALELENKSLREQNAKLSENDLDQLNEKQRILVDGMLTGRQARRSAMRYNPLILNDCLTLNRISRAAYAFLKKKFYLPLPSETCLGHYKAKMNRMVTDDDSVSSGSGGKTKDVVLAPADEEVIRAVEVISSDSIYDEQMPLEVCIDETYGTHEPLEVQTVEVTSSDLEVQTVEVMSSDVAGEFFVIPEFDQL